MKDLRELDPFRRLDWEYRAHGVLGDRENGCFVIERNGVELNVIASSGGGWDHVSVSTKDRCPTWEELEHIRLMFAKPHETWMQLHVPARDHVNCHPFCLHLWRPQHRELPRPPASFVGLRV